MKRPAEQGVRWSDIKPAQQTTLRPLEREWPNISVTQKRKWLELSARFPKLTSAEQARVQTRMAEWAGLTPEERAQARMNFQEAKLLPSADRQERWKAYQALSPEQRQKYASRTSAASAQLAGEALRRAGEPGLRAERPSGRETPQSKSNIVPTTNLAAQPKAVSPTVVQARSGATTTLMTKRPSPPSHQQTGLPKIAATPEFVNKATLLPQRGPQGAAVRSAANAASDPPDPPAHQ